MTDALIKRELLERLAGNGPTSTLSATRELRAILAAPRQPEGEGLEVVGLQWLDTGHYRKKPPKYGYNPHDWNELCRLSDHLRAIAELREECERVKADRASCWAEFKVMTRSCLEAEKERDTLRQQLTERDAELEQLKEESFEGLYNAVIDERDTLRQQLAEQDAEILEQCRLNGMGAERELKLLTQRDKLAGLLREVRTYAAMPMSCQIGMVEVCQCSRCRSERIDAALAEVKPCTESPNPAAT